MKKEFPIDQTLADFIELNRKHNETENKMLNLIADQREDIDNLMGMFLLITDAIKRASNNGVRLFQYLTQEESETLSVLLDKYGKGNKS